MCQSKFIRQTEKIFIDFIKNTRIELYSNEKLFLKESEHKIFNKIVNCSFHINFIEINHFYELNLTIIVISAV